MVYFSVYEESLKCLVTAAGLTIADFVIIGGIFQCVQGKFEVSHCLSRRFNHS